MRADLGSGESHVIDGKIPHGLPFYAKWIGLENFCYVLSN